MSESDLKAVFDSQALKDLIKKQESEYKLQGAIIERLDANIKAIGVLANIIAKRP